MMDGGGLSGLREWHPCRWLIALFLLALLVRAGGMIARGQHIPPAADPTGVPEHIIGTEAGVIAEHLLEGRGFATPFVRGESAPPSTHLPPLYPLLLAGLTWIESLLRDQVMTEPGLWAFYMAIGINLVASSLVPVVGVLIARAARWPPAVGWLGGLAMVFCPEAIRAVGLVWDEALMSLAAALLVLLIVGQARRLHRNERIEWRSMILVGLSSGFVSLLNPSMFPAVAVAWAVVSWSALQSSVARAASPCSRGRRLVPRLRLIMLHFIGVVLFGLLAGLPWHARNWFLLDDPAYVFVRGNFWLEVWTALHPIRFETGPEGQRICWPLHPWWRTDHPIIGIDGVTEQDYYAACRERALAWIRNNPSTYARHIGLQIVSFWTGIGDALRWQRSMFAFFILQGVPALLGILGLILARLRLRFQHHQSANIEWLTLRIFAAILLIFPLPYYTADAAIRYRHPIDLLLYLGLGWLLFILARSAMGMLMPGEFMQRNQLVR